MAAKRKAKAKVQATPTRRPGPGRFPRESYAQVEVHLISTKDRQLPSVVGELTVRLPKDHRATDMTIHVFSVQTLVAKS